MQEVIIESHKSELLESAIPEDPINLLTDGFMK
jgi:hypothetical protein